MMLKKQKHCLTQVNFLVIRKMIPQQKPKGNVPTILSNSIMLQVASIENKPQTMSMSL